MFDVVSSRNASGPWEIPGIAAAAPADATGWDGPGWGIPTVAGGRPAPPEAVASEPTREIPGADGLRFSITCQFCSRSLCFWIRLFFRSSSARSSSTSWKTTRQQQNNITGCTSKSFWLAHLIWITCVLSYTKITYITIIMYMYIKIIINFTVLLEQNI